MQSLKKLLAFFLESPRPIKRLITLSFDAVAVPFCIALALFVERGDAFVLEKMDLLMMLLVTVGSIVIFIRLGFYRAVLRYINVAAISVILVGVSVSAGLYVLLQGIFFKLFSINSGLFYWCFLTVIVGGSRLLFKAYMENINKDLSIVLIYGAGSAGRQLASALKFGDNYKPVAFIDDDPYLYRTQIDGLKVFAPIELNDLLSRYKVTDVLLAMPSVVSSRRAEILSILEPYPIRVKTVAGMEDIVTGKATISDLQEIDIEDLLGRDSIEPDQDLLTSCITNKIVMVTGAGGSIGSELCRQIIRLKPKSLLLYEISEFGLYAIEKELKQILKEESIQLELVALLGSVQHKNRLAQTMNSFKVQTVYHAAAYKHVPIVEQNIVEGIRNNVFGTWFAAEAAIDAQVEHFVLISTDKAVRPTNVMGASKRLAELVLQALHQRQKKLKKSSTLFTMVRFGNVLGSSGSVVPLFREQIKKGGPVTVTHQDIIRYFMTIPEAAQLVIQAGAMGHGGDVFVLDMGEPVKIASLAERMVHLMGKSIQNSQNPTGEIAIEFTGLRPGEKLFEELLIGDNVTGTEHSRIMTANEASIPWNDMETHLMGLNAACGLMDCETIIHLLLSIPTIEYNPQHDVCDLLWSIDRPEELYDVNADDFGKKVIPLKKELI